MKNKNTLTNDKNRLILALKTVAVNNSITQEAIAVKTGLKQPNISRFFAQHNTPSLQTFILIANAIGAKIEIKNNEK